MTPYDLCSGHVVCDVVHRLASQHRGPTVVATVLSVDCKGVPHSAAQCCPLFTTITPARAALGAHTLTLLTYFLYRYFVTLLAFLLIYCTMYGMLSVNFVAQQLAETSVFQPKHGWFRCMYRCIVHCVVRSPWCRVLLEQLTGLQLVNKFPAFHGTRRFISSLTSVRHLSLSWASPIQSIYPHSTSWRSVLILSTHLRLGLPSGLFPSGFPTKTLYNPLSSPIRATYPAHLILLDFITRTIIVVG